MNESKFTPRPFAADKPDLSGESRQKRRARLRAESKAARRQVAMHIKTSRLSRRVA